MESKLLIFVVLSFCSSVFGQLTYNFTIPYAGAGMLTIYNEGASASLSSLVFTTNAVIAGSPYGTLFPFTASISSAPNGILTTYTITYSPAFALPSGSAEITYTYNSQGGPLGLGMGPASVSASTGGSLTPVLISGHCEGEDCNDPTPGFQSSGYYPSWGMYARGFDAIDLPVRYLNQIYYAFIGFHEDGSVYLLDSNSDPKQIPSIGVLMERYPYLHASLSFGGWTLSAPFSQMANNSESLNNFLTNVVNALQETQFDGVDIDWEYPVLNGAPGEPTYETPQDAESYPNMLYQMRLALNNLAAANKKSGTGPTQYYISIAGPGGIDKLEALQKYNPNGWATVIKSVDVVNVMSYDFHGAFDQSNPPPYDVSDFMSAMVTSPEDPFYQNPLLRQYDVVSPIAMYLQLGFASTQIGLGLPAYGRLVEVASIGETFGLYQTITGTPPGQYDSTGSFDYKCIQERQCNGYTQLPEDIIFVNPTSSNLGNCSHTPWGYSTSTSTFLTYDNADSATYKTCWAKTNNFRGFMVWDLSEDFVPSDPNSIVGAAFGVVTGATSCSSN